MRLIDRLKNNKTPAPFDTRYIIIMFIDILWLKKILRYTLLIHYFHVLILDLLIKASYNIYNLRVETDKYKVISSKQNG